MWKTRSNQTNERSAGPARFRISGMRWWVFCNKHPIGLRWRSWTGARGGLSGRQDGALRWWLRFAPNQPSRWCLSKDFPGEFSQHDFGEVEADFLNGASRRIHFFASRLSNRAGYASVWSKMRGASLGADSGRPSGQLGRAMGETSPRLSMAVHRAEPRTGVQRSEFWEPG
jgi:hypothetical protein